ncbi:MAG: phosphoserine phosphatase, partial [Candidatus Thermoplasmatota archaeon]|nr:phosphoserine phosphatase [Candidatus Thermoplasmatota archaeon]
QRAQEEHEYMIELIKQLDNLTKKVNNIQETIVLTKIEADYVHKEFIECVDKIHDLERQISSTHERKRKTKKSEELTIAQKEANEIFEKFKRGEKLSTEDLMTLQKAGLI